METIGQLYNTEVNMVNLQSENTREWDIGISFTTRHNLCIGVNLSRVHLHDESTTTNQNFTKHKIN